MLAYHPEVIILLALNKRQYGRRSSLPAVITAEEQTAQGTDADYHEPNRGPSAPSQGVVIRA